MIVSNDPNSTVGRVISTVGRVISTVGRFISTNRLPRWKKNLLRSGLEHDIIYSDQEDQTDPGARRSLPHDQERTMFEVFYKIEVYLRLDHSVDAFLSIRQTGDDDWELLGGLIDINEKALIPNLVKKVSHAVKFHPGHIMSGIGFHSALDFDSINEIMYDDFAESDLIVAITFDGHCDTGVYFRTYPEILDDCLLEHLFG